MKGLNMSDIATWSIPTGPASDKTRKWPERVHYYRIYEHHYLKDETKIMPDVATCMTVLRCYDEFGPDFPVAIEEKSYLKV